jgi:hypothetical protein
LIVGSATIPAGWRPQFRHRPFLSCEAPGARLEALCRFVRHGDPEPYASMLLGRRCHMDVRHCQTLPTPGLRAAVEICLKVPRRMAWRPLVVNRCLSGVAAPGEWLRPRRLSSALVLNAGSKVLGPDRPAWTTGHGRLADWPTARITGLWGTPRRSRPRRRPRPCPRRNGCGYPQPHLHSRQPRPRTVGHRQQPRR